jgi:(1->4)-alpha-D-glucan 1-alpha-D-glucosylmutase
VTAKGVEDTAFYTFHRLTSLTEVGGDPDRFGVPPEEVHRALAARRETWPTALGPLSTHDTKRSEDVRARINALSEIPGQWADRLARWAQLNEPHRPRVDDQPVPDPNEEYFLYQNLLGAWPLGPTTGEEMAAFIKRMQGFFTKALHEAKVHTSWANPHGDYDSAAEAFVGAILDESANPEFLADFREFHARVSEWGMINSLSQTLLRLTAPGVPDTYQGTELWDFSLVDPDNRRPVDYGARSAALANLKARVNSAGDDRRGLVRELIEARADGRIKLYLTWSALEARRNRPGLFAEGEYSPLAVEGGKAEHAFGFARRQGEEVAIVVVPRLPATLVPDGSSLPLGSRAWGDTSLQLPPEWGLGGRSFRNAFTGETVTPTAEGSISAAGLFADFPAALLLV